MINQNHKKKCRTFSSFSAVAGSVSISPFAFLVGIPIGIASSATTVKICAAAAGIKMSTSIMEKKKKKHNKIVLLAKNKLNTVEILFFKALTDLNISHDEFVLVNNVLGECNEMKKK